MAQEYVNVIFQPSGRRGKVPKGCNIIEASRLLGVDIEALCGETKVCGKCIVRIEEGHFEKYNIQSSMDNVSPWQEEVEAKFITPETREKGFRLGCVATIENDILVFVPEESRAGKQVVSKAARDIHIDSNPAIKIYTIELKKPDFEDKVGDWERLCNGLAREYGLTDLTCDIITLRTLPGALRAKNWTVTVSVWNDKEVIRIQPGKIKHVYGIAIDVGTTTCAGYLCNLTTMEVIATSSLMNPQCKYGEDVMARITFHMTTPGGLKRMSDDIIEGINSLIEKAIEQTHPKKKKIKKKKGEDGPTEYKEIIEEGVEYLRINKEDIEDVTMGFNTAMHHILL
ncbi:MAG: 2Fe-2S iron-sulfur cluster binding domain-containing protein, partial [Desulfobacula sp.]|nr:2Fe-2S iron-sulfur cluster binding domain-containing protein [Desulfobacula sp.]